MLSPKKLAIYYGRPRFVNNVNTIIEAIDIFEDYDLIVFKEGIENVSHIDHQDTIDIIAGLPSTSQVYGYVDSSNALSQIETSIDQLFTMGVQGIFCTKFGYDYIDRIKQNDIVDYIHSKGLIAFVHAPTIEDAMENNGIPTNLTSTDWYLNEKFQINNGSYQNPTTWKTNSDIVATYSNNIQIACITTYDSSAFDQNKLDYAYMSCVLYKFHAFGWGEELYSSNSNSLPFRTRPSIQSNSFINNITEPVIGIYQRNTNIGISINTTNHTINLITL